MNKTIEELTMPELIKVLSCTPKEISEKTFGELKKEYEQQQIKNDIKIWDVVEVSPECELCKPSIYIVTGFREQDSTYVLVDIDGYTIISKAEYLTRIGHIDWTM